MNLPFRKECIGLLVLVSVTASLPAASSEEPVWLIVQGAGGTDRFAAEFTEVADIWSVSARSQGIRLLTVGQATDAGNSGKGPDMATTPDLDQLRAHVKRETAIKTSSPLIMVLIGHGTFDGETAKFNLKGPDLSAGELKALLDGSTRPFVLINCSSSSAPFINAVSANGRCIVTATRSGFEQSYSRFAIKLAEVISEGEAVDLDKDGQTSLLEAFLAASRSVEQFYVDEGRLATEHALLDDNGDERGSPPDRFPRVISALSGSSSPVPEGRLASGIILVSNPRERELSPRQRSLRDELELEISGLRSRKTEFSDEDAYYSAIEPLFLRLSELYRSSDSGTAEP